MPFTGWNVFKFLDVVGSRAVVGVGLEDLKGPGVCAWKTRMAAEPVEETVEARSGADRKRRHFLGRRFVLFRSASRSS